MVEGPIPSPFKRDAKYRQVFGSKGISCGSNEERSPLLSRSMRRAQDTTAATNSLVNTKTH